MKQSKRHRGTKKAGLAWLAVLCLAAVLISGCSRAAKPMVATMRRSDVDISTLTYTPPSYTRVDEIVAEAYALMEDKSGLHLVNRIKMYRLIGELEQLLEEVNTQTALMFITYLQNQTDADAQLAYTDMETRVQGYAVDLTAMYAYVTGEDLTPQQQAAAENRAEIEALSAAEAQLLVAYNQLYYQIDTMQVDIDGTPMTYEEMRSLPSLTAYQKAWDVWFEQVNGKLTQLYRELLQIRNALAEAYGYDTYRAYADEQLYYRDVDTAKLAPIRAQIRTCFAAPVAQMYDLYYAGAENPVSLDMQAGMQAVDNMIAATPKQMRDCYAYLKQHGSLLLCDLPTCSRTAYTFTFHQFHQPFVYVGWVPGNMAETTVLHELGHAFADFATDYNSLSAYNSYEVMELQSMSLEYMGSFSTQTMYGAYNQVAELWNSGECITDLAYMAAVGTFEDAVYQNPTMTDEEMLRLYVETFHSYGLLGTQSTADTRLLWLENSIFVQSPFYADSYLLAGLGATEMSLNYLDDHTKTMTDYMQLLRYQGDFAGALQAAGLTDVLAEDYVPVLFARMQQKNLLEFDTLVTLLQREDDKAA